MRETNITGIGTLMFTNKAQIITAQKQFAEGSFLLQNDEGNSPQNYIVADYNGKGENWNHGQPIGSNPWAGILKGLLFRWGQNYTGYYVIGSIRGGNYNNSSGFGIGRLEEDGNIIPLLRITEDALYFMEKKIAGVEDTEQEPDTQEIGGGGNLVIANELDKVLLLMSLLNRKEVTL